MTVTITRSRNFGRLPRSGGRRLEPFTRAVLDHYRTHGRHGLPWRKTRDPYRILVSEIMLQQTRATTVVPKYEAFLKKFPSVGVLARAPLSVVLRHWQGLGYNRRAKMLHDAGRILVARHGSKVPRAYDALRALPGVGDYTARAIRVFAFNEPEVFIETNIRAAFLHHFFPRTARVADRAILPLVQRSLDKENPRRWYSALMDYGSFLKATRPNPSRRSAHHMRQKPFKGSDREIRGAILRARLAGMTLSRLPFDKKRLRVQALKLKAEGLI